MFDETVDHRLCASLSILDLLKCHPNLKAMLSSFPTKDGVRCYFHQIPAALDSISSPGHLRPLTVLAARIVETRPTYVTFLTTPRFFDRVQAELSRSIDLDDSIRRDLIRHVSRAFEHYQAVNLYVGWLGLLPCQWWTMAAF